MSKQKSDRSIVLLLDAHALLHRAYHALPDFTNVAGEPTGALYGYVSMIFSAIEKFKPTYVVACYDLPGKTFRHDAFSDYKSGRSKTDEALVMQIKRSHKVCEALSIPIYAEPGFEADDMLGTIVAQVTSDSKPQFKDLDIVIASGDMDTLQLVQDKRVQVYTLKRGLKDTVVYDQQAVIDRYGFGPDRVIDYKGLRGDPSDNIPGIKGIGEKAATNLLTTIGGIDAIYAALDANPNAIVDAGLRSRVQDLVTQGREEALFSKVLATIHCEAPVTFAVPKKAWLDTIDTDVVQKLFIDLEFRSLWVKVNKLLDRDLSAIEAAEPKPAATEAEIHELSVATWLLNPDHTNPDLETIYETAHTRDFAKAKDRIYQRLKADNLWDVFTYIEKPIISIIDTMQQYGITLDTKRVTAIAATFTKQMKQLESEIYKLAGHEFNVRSTQQLSDVLFAELNLPTKGIKKTKAGKYSTAESELEKLRSTHDIVAYILDYRELHKLVSTYLDPLPTYVAKDGRIHATFLQAGTTTGRFSSKDPNLQNIPVRGKHGKLIRDVFIASPGHTLVSFDYSQIELRCAAIMSKDPHLVEIFETGQDVHASVAAKVFDVDPSKVTAEMRSQAKVINFGILYGMGVSALTKNLKTTRAEAQTFYDQYFATFTTLKQYLDETKANALQFGYTQTLFGRRRYFPALSSSLAFVRAAAERTAINAPIQGTATADIIKLAISQVDAKLQQKNLANNVHLILQIHDELMYEVADDKVDEIIPLITTVMQDVIKNSYLDFTTTVPLLVNAASAKSWGDMKD